MCATKAQPPGCDRSGAESPGSPDAFPTTLVALAGRCLVVAGVLLIGFATYQLWGTSLIEAEAQQRLDEELAARIARAPLAPTTDRDEPPLPVTVWRPVEDESGGIIAAVDRTETPTPTPPTELTPVSAPVTAEGEPWARIIIPSIDLDKVVVEGTSRDALRTGPGHYRGTARPGWPGNVAIAGHRTTYGAPFRHLDQLEPGDEIVLETTEGSFTYLVEAQVDSFGESAGHRIVSPTEVEVIGDRGDNRITLTACHPLYSARQRIVVTGLLVEPAQGAVTPAASIEPMSAEPTVAPLSPVVDRGPEPRPTPPRPASLAAEAGTTTEIDDGLGWDLDHVGATTRWAGLAALVALAGWLLGRWWRPGPAYAVASPALVMALLTCFAHLDQLLPAA